MPIDKPKEEKRYIQKIHEKPNIVSKPCTRLLGGVSKHFKLCDNYVRAGSVDPDKIRVIINIVRTCGICF